MPRRKRIISEGLTQHLIQRGNNRDVCFFTQQDYPVYLVKLQEYAEKYSVQIHAFILMTNHIHILATPLVPQGVSKMFQALGRYYVMYINRTYNRTGSLWDGRFKSVIVDNEAYLLTVYRYIELNPVRANMVEHPAHYPWSSYRYNAMGKAIKLITPHSIYTRLGQRKVQRLQAYRSLFKNEISDLDMEMIRQATKHMWVLGDDCFQSLIEKEFNQGGKLYGHGGDRRSQRFKKL